MVNKNKGSVRQLKFIDAMGYDMKCMDVHDVHIFDS